MEFPSSYSTVPTPDQAAGPQFPAVPLTSLLPPPPGPPPAGTIHLAPPVYPRARPSAIASGQFTYRMSQLPDLPAAPVTPQPRQPLSQPPVVTQAQQQAYPPPSWHQFPPSASSAQPDVYALLIGIITNQQQQQQQQLDLQRQQTELLLAQHQRTRPDPGIKQFKELHPHTFYGTETPLQAEEWLRHTSDLLYAAKIPRNDWVTIACLQLSDNARNWWDAEMTRLTSPVSWETFTERFNAKHFPYTARTELENQFINLVQGTMTVNEYDAEYSRLGR